MYCPSPGAITQAGNCSDGYYCAGNATTSQPTDGTTGDQCPTGNYCPAGAGQPIPCEDGTYAGMIIFYHEESDLIPSITLSSVT